MKKLDATRRDFLKLAASASCVLPALDLPVFCGRDRTLFIER